MLHRRTGSHQPGPLGIGVTGAIAAILAVVGLGLGLRGFTAATHVVYEALDTGTNPGIEASTLTTVSGGPGSLVAWDTMGRWGRDFAALTTSRDALRAFHGDHAEIKDPIRVFVGVRSAPTVEARAALVVHELERTGAFDRSVLVVWVPAGSGWMDPDASIAIEQLYAGDTAIAAMQYSFLPSFFAQVMAADRAIEAAMTSAKTSGEGAHRRDGGISQRATARRRSTHPDPPGSPAPSERTLRSKAPVRSSS